MLFDTPFSVLPVTNKQFFPFGRVHQTRLISLNLLSQVSVLLRSLRSPTQNFDSPFGLPQDDTQTRPRTTDLPSHRSSKNGLPFLTSAKRYHA